MQEKKTLGIEDIEIVSTFRMKVAPRAGFEPATNRLTAGCSTAELPGNRCSLRQRGGV